MYAFLMMVMFMLPGQKEPKVFLVQSPPAYASEELCKKEGEDLLKIALKGFPKGSKLQVKGSCVKAVKGDSVDG